MIIFVQCPSIGIYLDFHFMIKLELWVWEEEDHRGKVTFLVYHIKGANYQMVNHDVKLISCLR